MKASRLRHRRRTPPHAASATQAQSLPTGVARLAAPSRPTAGPVAASPWTGDDAQWLPRARQAWLAGDWVLLSALAECPLHRHPDRGRLSLLAAAGRFHGGDAAGTRALIEQAMAWGCDKRLVARVLVAGLHNTLGRASVALDQPARALAHFTAAVVTAAPTSSVRTAAQARSGEQLAQIGLTVGLPDLLAAPPSVAGPARPGRPVAQWPAGAVPAGPLRGAAVRAGDWQYFVHDTAGGVRVLQRRLPAGAPTASELEAPASGVLAVSVDVEGHVRVQCGSAAWRSLAPHDVGAWTATAAQPLPEAGATPFAPIAPVELGECTGGTVVAYEGTGGRLALLVRAPLADGVSDAPLWLLDYLPA